MAHLHSYTSEQKSMKDSLTDLIKVISDSGNPIVSKIITYFGVAGGVGGGTVQVVASKTANEFIQECANVTPDWLAYVPAIGVLSLIVKHAADIYFKRKELKIRSDSE